MYFHDKGKTNYEVRNKNAADATRHLQNLVGQELLEQTGSSRGSVYHIKGMRIPGPEDVFDSSHLSPSSSHLPESSSHLNPSSSHLNPSSIHLNPSSSHLRNEDGLLISKDFELPFLDNLDELSESIRQSLEKLARLPREKRKIRREEMERVICNLCRGHFIRLDILSKLLDRKPDSLRNNYLTVMKRAGLLQIAFPRTPNDPRQAYTLADDDKNAS